MSAMALAPVVSFRLPVLPWAGAVDDERRFRRILRLLLGLALVATLVLPLIPPRSVGRIEAQPLPPAVAKLLLERPLAPPVPSVMQKPPEPAPAPDAAAAPPHPAARPEPVTEKQAAPVPEARRPVEGKPPGEVALEQARRKASGVGLLAMKNELAEITGAPVAVQLRQDIRPGPGVGSGSGPGVGAGSEAGVPVRAMIAGAATRGSGGISTAAYSRDTGGGGLAGRATTMVEGAAGGGGAGGPGAGGARAASHGDGAGKGGTLNRGGAGKASRSLEDVKLVFERNKGAIYAIYNRALRDDPALQGKVVLELKIAPGGQVTDLRIVSSELKAEDLERKLLARIRQFDFGAKDVEVMVVSWPVDFLPS